MFNFSFFLDAAREFFTFVRFVTNPHLLDDGVTAMLLSGTGDDLIYTPARSEFVSGTITELTFSASYELTQPDGSTTVLNHPFLIWHDLSLDAATFNSATGTTSLDAFMDATINSDPGYDFTKFVETFAFDPGGQLLDTPRTVLAYFGDNTLRRDAVLGTDDDDYVLLSNTGRVDVGNGNDTVQSVEHAQPTDVFLRRGDDVYLGAETPDPDHVDTFQIKTARGGLGDDTLIGGAYMDRLRGDRGDDKINGAAGDDALFGGAGDDFIFGGSGNDQIHGGVGKDVLHGDSGSDGVRGGLGQDIFWIELSDISDPALPSETDIFYDYTHGTDRLHVTNRDGSDLSRRDAWALFQDAATQQGDDTVFTHGGTTTVFRDVSLRDFRLNSFYEKPWLLENVSEDLAF